MHSVPHVLKLGFFGHHRGLLTGNINLFLTGTISLSRLLTHLETRTTRTTRDLIKGSRVQHRLRLNQSLLTRNARTLRRLNVITRTQTLVRLDLLTRRVRHTINTNQNLTLKHTALGNGNRHLVLSLTNAQTRPGSQMLPLQNNRVATTTRLTSSILSTPSQFTQRLAMTTIFIRVRLTGTLNITTIRRINSRQLTGARKAHNRVTRNDTNRVNSILSLRLHRTITTITTTLNLIHNNTTHAEH